MRQKGAENMATAAAGNVPVECAWGVGHRPFALSRYHLAPRDCFPPPYYTLQ